MPASSSTARCARRPVRSTSGRTVVYGRLADPVTIEHSRLCRIQRRLVAWLGHAPGLWLCYREPLPRELRAPNARAVAATLVAIGVAVVVVDRATTATAALVT